MHAVMEHETLRGWQRPYSAEQLTGFGGVRESFSHRRARFDGFDAVRGEPQCLVDAFVRLLGLRSFARLVRLICLVRFSVAFGHAPIVRPMRRLVKHFRGGISNGRTGASPVGECRPGRYRVRLWDAVRVFLRGP